MRGDVVVFFLAIFVGAVLLKSCVIANPKKAHGFTLHLGGRYLH